MMRALFHYAHLFHFMGIVHIGSPFGFCTDKATGFSMLFLSMTLPYYKQFSDIVQDLSPYIRKKNVKWNRAEFGEFG